MEVFGITSSHTWTEISMPLKEGSLKTLATSPHGLEIEINELASSVLRQMLEALKYTPGYDVIPRNQNPTNYPPQPQL